MAQRQWQAARVLLERAIGMGPQSAGAYNDYGRVLNNLGQLEAAGQAFASALGLDPDFAEAHNNLGHVLRAQGDYVRAEHEFARAVVLQPDYAQAHFNRASALNLLGRNEQAVASLRSGLRLAPDDALAHFNLATLYRLLDHYEPARTHFAEAIRLRPELPEAHVGLAGLQVHLGELDPALATYRALLDVAPDSQEARVGVADIMALMGDSEAALASLSPDLLAGESEMPGLAVARARLQNSTGRHESALATLQELRQRDPAACAGMPGFYFALADVCDRLGRYDEAMAHYHRANGLKDERFDAAELRAAVDSLINVFSEDWLRRAPRSANTSRRPVFIVGMPRSGTSLVEQILASHPLIFGAGELNVIGDFVRELGASPDGRPAYPACVRGLSVSGLDELAGRYLAFLESLDSTAERVTDKLPHNFLHLGLIALLFPNCRIIHCRRDYRDTALSCYFQNFSSAAMAFTNTFAGIGEYYRQYLRLMAHWQQVLQIPVHEVHYETLVAAQEPESRRLVEFVGLDWDPACLRFYEAKRFVNTASHAQVGRPVYASSVARHRHYVKHLGPLPEAVGELP